MLPGGHGDSSQVKVVPDRVLEVVVHPALGEPGVQVLAQITGDGTRKYGELKSDKDLGSVCLKSNVHTTLFFQFYALFNLVFGLYEDHHFVIVNCL